MAKRLLLLLAVCALVFPADAQRRRTSRSPVPEPLSGKFGGGPLPNLPPEELDEFLAGRAEFLAKRSVAEGLGPVFNRRSCVECHQSPVVGGSGFDGHPRFGVGAGEEAVFGGPVVQTRAIGPRDGSPHQFQPELTPREATVVTRHRPSSLLGLGLVEATDDATFIALAQMQAVNNPTTAGRAALVDDPQSGTKRVGKFGWKARIATLLEFSGDAYLNELGITSPAFPHENCPSGNCDELQFNPRPGLNDGGEDIRAAASFMRFLAPPPRSRAITPEVLAGEAIFHRIGCAACHVPELQTGANPNPALDRITYAPYSDFLLHDMGSLGDGLTQGDAGPREMRTAPLWGLGARQGLLHDGRTGDLPMAIANHDGQARTARVRFEALAPAERAQLIQFLRSL